MIYVAGFFFVVCQFSLCGRLCQSIDGLTKQLKELEYVVSAAYLKWTRIDKR